MNSEESFQYIKNIIDQKEPHIFLRLGLTEARYMEKWLVDKNPQFIKFLLDGMQRHWLECTGFFPVQNYYIERFLNLYSEIVTAVSQLPNRTTYIPTLSSDVLDEVFKDCKKLEGGTNPFYSYPIFQSELVDKKICVVSCFPKTFRSQCHKLEMLFDDKRLKNLYPKNITFIKSPPHKFISSPQENPFSNWFQALDQMVEEINYTDYDIMLTGCGAFSLPLCYHAFKSKKIALNLGGDLQLLFGVKGKRWDNPYYKYNEYWINPLPEETPSDTTKVEGGCYW